MLKQHKKAHHQIRLNREFRSDILWWTNFIAPWNGVSYLFAGPTSEFTSDVSGSWGCGAHTTDSWFQMQWNEQSSPLSITIKELLLIMFAVVVWGRRWQAQKVLCHCDNQAVVVAALRSRSSKQPQLMHMLRCLFFVEALYGFELSASYIPTKANDLADDISRNNLSSFLCKVPALKGKSSRSIAGDPDRHVGGLDVTKLDASLQGYFHSGLAPSTHRSYDCALRRFNSFCMQYNVSDPFPVTEKLLCYFSTKLADDGLAPQTITSPQFEACSYP